MIEIDKLKPFPKFCYTIGMIPTSYKESLTYEEQLIWFCSFLQDTVIPTVNNNANAVEELQNLYVELHDYVEHYFDNLDVQEEINNKLDKLAQDGTLTNLIRAYIDPIFLNYKSQIDNNVANLSAEIDEINTKVDSATSGSPLVASSTSEMTDTTRVYVNTTDGKWYYYNGSEWTVGGTYQSTGISPNTIDYEMFSSKLKNDFNYKINYKDDLVHNNILKLPFVSSDFKNTNISTSTGEFTSDGDTQRIALKNHIYLPQNAYFDFDLLNDVNYGCVLYFYDINKTFITYILIKTNFKGKIIIPNAYYFNVVFSNTQGIIPSDIENINMYFKLLENNKVTYSLNDNKVNLDLISENCYISNSDGALTSSNTYSTTDYIPVEEGKQYTIKNRTRFIHFYDYRKAPVAGSYDNTGKSANYQFFPPSNAKYIRFTYYNSDSDIMLYEGTVTKPYEIFKKIIEKNASLSEIMKSEVEEIINTKFSGNVLFGKKLVTCGDSFTQYTNAQFDDGIYAGENKVYPYLIGLRNNMTVNNMAVSGGTMATGDFTAANKFSAGLYQQIDNDADYILLKYGINDLNNNVPIGTINDTQTTTFYGAWNTVMSYIIEHHPTAKIGIIVTNGLLVDTDDENNSPYASAIINIAKKYGIPTLNEWNDPNVPLLLRTGRTDVDEDIRNERLETFRVSEDNTHENYICHEYESTIIENFLRSL